MDRRYGRQNRQSAARSPVVIVPSPAAFAHATRPVYSVGRGARLHIGCGKKRLVGWINADGVPGVGDVVMDLQSQFQPQAYSEIYGSHVLEHCWPEDTPKILKNLFNALLPGGTLRLSVPDIRLVLKNCIDGHAYGDERSALAVIHGGSFSKDTAAPDLHRQTFWKERLHRLLAEAGFTNIREWGRGQYTAIDALQDFATYPFDMSTGKSLISLNMEADRPGVLKVKPDKAIIDVSVILGTVERGEMLHRCVEAIRESLKGSDYSHEIVIAYGRKEESNLPWMHRQHDIVPVLGGMDGAIEAFNKTYAASRGKYVCQINDDVLVEGDSIARALRHLDGDESSAGVVFKFDRNDGKGYRHETLVGALHPNQMVVRRDTCEAVVERIGAFWGDAQHRTDKTYGGDTAFGVVCKYLGLRLDSVEGVKCRDLLAADQLRADNQASVSKEHGERWRAMFAPYMTTVVQPKSDEWPALYVPRPGRFPRLSPVEAGRPLRLLHMSGRSPNEPLTEMRAAFAKIGPTVELPWAGNMRNVLEAASQHKPEVVFAQIQSNDWTTENYESLRKAVDHNCVLVLWTGDVRTHSAQPVERWLSRAGNEFDIVLASNTTYARKLKLDEGVTAACGFMSCGVEVPDPAVLGHKEDPDAGAVFLGTNYPSLDHGARSVLFDTLLKAEVCPLTIYGHGWERTPLARVSKGYLNKIDARTVIRTTPVTIVTSLFADLGRYTSDRLARTASAGGVLAVRKFVDMEGLGLRHGENCLTWSTTEELIALLRQWTAPSMAAQRAVLRENVVSLARQKYVWDHSVQELLAIVRDYRFRRGLT